MTLLRPTNFRLEDGLVDAMPRLKDRDGISVSEQVRRALRAFLEERGVSAKPAPKKAGKKARP